MMTDGEAVRALIKLGADVADVAKERDLLRQEASTIRAILGLGEGAATDDLVSVLVNSLKDNSSP